MMKGRETSHLKSRKILTKKRGGKGRVATDQGKELRKYEPGEPRQRSGELGARQKEAAAG